MNPSGTSLMNSTNSEGPSTLPWETPPSTDFHSDFTALMSTHVLLDIMPQSICAASLQSHMLPLFQGAFCVVQHRTLYENPSAWCPQDPHDSSIEAVPQRRKVIETYMICWEQVHAGCPQTDQALSCASPQHPSQHSPWFFLPSKSDLQGGSFEQVFFNPFLMDQGDICNPPIFM